MFVGYQGMSFGDDTEILNPFIQKLEKGELTLEEILEEDEIIKDIRSNNDSKFINFFTSEKIKKLIDYSTKIPSKDEHNIGYKYPFNATEILCSDCPNFQTILMTEKILNGGGNNKKLKKNGFIFQLFKKINSVKKEIIKEENKDHKNDDETKENEEEEEEEEDSDFDSDEEIEIEDKNNVDENDKNQNVLYENVDYLLEFLKSDEANENYVLAGYFHRILSNLMKVHQMKIVKYLLDYPKKSELDILCLLIKHMNRKSTCNIIQKLLMFTDDLISKYDENKMNLVSKIFDELDNSNDTYKNECICDCISCVMNNRQFFDVFMTKNELLEKIYKILFNCKESNKYNSIIKLLIKLNENIIQNFSVNYTTSNNNENNNEMKGETSLSCPDDNTEVLKKYLLTLFEVLEKSKFKFFENFGNDYVGEFMSTYLEKQKKIGEKKILQIEYIKTVVDILVNSNAAKFHENKLEAIVNAANEQKIFWSCHELFFDFPFSNIYQIYYSQIMNIICNENSPKCLVEAVLNEKVGEKRNLIQFYINKILSDLKFSFKLTKAESFNPCFSYAITILNKIFTSQNSHIAAIIKNNKDLSVFYEVIGKEVENVFNQKLLLSDNFGGFGDIEDAPLQTFGPQNFMEMLEENCKIYEMYKNGENYEKVLEEKKERIEREKQKEKKESINLEKRGLQYIDDMDEEDDPFFKVEKVKKDKDNFLSILNKQPPNYTNEVKKEDNMKTIDNDDEEEDKDNFLSILNKPKEDDNKDKENNDNNKNNENNENEKDYFKELYGEVNQEELNEDNNNIENSDKKKERITI